MNVPAVLAVRLLFDIALSPELDYRVNATASAVPQIGCGPCPIQGTLVLQSVTERAGVDSFG